MPPRSLAVRAAVRAALAAAAALLLFAGHPPLSVGVAGWFALVPLLVLARDIERDAARPVRTGALWGLAVGVGLFGPLLWFLSRFGIAPWWLLTVMQSITVGAFLAGVVAWGSRPGRPLMVVVWWVALEAVRSAVPLGGFSWGVLGYTQHAGGLLLPTARVLGVLGVSAVCAAIAATSEEVVHRLRHRRRAAGDPASQRPAGAARSPLVPAAAGVAVLAVCGLVAVGVRPPAANGDTIDIAGVQGSADIRASSAAGVARVDVGRIVRVAQEMVEATRPLAVDPPDVTVWPENALDADIRVPGNDGVRQAAADALEILGGQPLLSGLFLDGPRDNTLYNAMALVTPDGVEQTYLKRKPVPFGEYVPARRYLDWYPALDQLPTDVLAGDRVGLIDVGPARIGGVICFENIFPELVRDQVLEGANVLVVSTNNSSWGSAAASEQHLAFTQLRAVETGRWALHAGLSGISAIVDPSGVLSQRTEVFVADIVRDDLPLVDGLTPAMRIGWMVGPAAIVASLAGIGVLLLSRRPSGPTGTSASATAEPRAVGSPEPAATDPNRSSGADGPA